jgi:hypothetical protein
VTRDRVEVAGGRRRWGYLLHLPDGIRFIDCPTDLHTTDDGRSPVAGDRSATPILRPVWPLRTPMPTSGADPEFISIPEWARRLGISAESGYKAARLGEIPGCFNVGRLYRVNWPVFVEATAGLRSGPGAAG